MTSESAREISESTEDAELYIEVRGIYDGWSVAQMKDGRMLNRWPPDDRRHKPTQDWIDGMGAGDE